MATAPPQILWNPQTRAWEANPDLSTPGLLTAEGGKVVPFTQPAAAPAATAPAPVLPAVTTYPQSVPTVTATDPAISALIAALGAGMQDTPVATGVDIYQMQLDNILKSETLRQSSVDQQVRIAQLFSQGAGANIAQQAELAIRLGIPGLEPDLSFASAFAGPGSTGTFGGRIGSQDVRLPFAFSGKELSFLGQNPSVANPLQQVASFLGRPDAISTSLASLIPAGGNIFTQ